MLNFVEKAEQKKELKRTISFTKIEIPKIPECPSQSTSTEEIMDLILQVLPYSD